MTICPMVGGGAENHRRLCQADHKLHKLVPNQLFEKSLTHEGVLRIDCDWFTFRQFSDLLKPQDLEDLKNKSVC